MIFLHREQEGWSISIYGNRIPIEFWSERDEMCLYTIWNGEWKLDPYRFMESYIISDEEYHRARNRFSLVDLAWECIAKDIYVRVCDWREQTPAGIINDLKPRSISCDWPTNTYPPTRDLA